MSQSNSPPLAPRTPQSNGNGAYYSSSPPKMTTPMPPARSSSVSTTNSGANQRLRPLPVPPPPPQQISQFASTSSGVQPRASQVGLTDVTSAETAAAKTDFGRQYSDSERSPPPPKMDQYYSQSPTSAESPNSRYPSTHETPSSTQSGGYPWSDNHTSAEPSPNPYGALTPDSGSRIAAQRALSGTKRERPVGMQGPPPSSPEGGHPYMSMPVPSVPSPSSAASTPSWRGRRNCVSVPLKNDRLIRGESNAEGRPSNLPLFLQNRLSIITQRIPAHIHQAGQALEHRATNPNLNPTIHPCLPSPSPPLPTTPRSHPHPLTGIGTTKPQYPQTPTQVVPRAPRPRPVFPGTLGITLILRSTRRRSRRIGESMILPDDDLFSDDV